MDCFLDFETRSEEDLAKAGAIRYAKHPSTAVLCLAYKIDDGPVKLWLPERSPMPADLWEAFLKATLVAHNAGFERAIIAHCLANYLTLNKAQTRILRNIPISRWRCTAAKAAACSLPRALEKVAKALDLSIEKDMEGNRLMKKYSKPRKPSKNNPSTWWDDPQELRKIYRYCMKDIHVEYAVDQALPDLTADEQLVWEMNEEINDYGVGIDIETVKLILDMVNQEKSDITKRVRKLSENTLDTANQTTKLLAWVNKHGAGMQNLQAATIRDKLLEPNLSKQVREMLTYRQHFSKSSTGKYKTMLAATDSDGNRARELVLYAGTAPTMRFSGRRIQPHNFPRPMLKGFDSDIAIRILRGKGIDGIRNSYGKDKVMDVLASCTRGMLIPSPGCEFFCADWSNVEARLTFWLADHEEGVKAFRDGRKLYEEMAATAFGCDLKWLLTQEGKSSLERFVGKESVLGCGYGMGWKKFLLNCHRKGVPQVTEEMAKKAVFGYRELHWPVPELWSKLQDIVISAISNPKKRYTTNRCTAYVANDFLHIKIPSGQKLRYYRPRLVGKQLDSGKIVPEIRYMGMDNHKWQEIAIWGGVLTNHVIQRIARNLMVNSIRNVRKRGYRFLLSVHDEGLGENDIGRGSVEEYNKLFSTPPAWCDDAPLESVTWTGMRYKKG